MHEVGHGPVLPSETHACVDFVSSLGLVSSQQSAAISSKSMEAFLSSFASILSERLAAPQVLAPSSSHPDAAGVPLAAVDASLALHGTWRALGQEEEPTFVDTREASPSFARATTLASCHAVEDELSGTSQLDGGNLAGQCQPVRSCSEVHQRQRAAAAWLSRVLDRCVRRARCHAMLNLVDWSEEASSVRSREEEEPPRFDASCAAAVASRAVSAPPASGSLAARARRLVDPHDAGGTDGRVDTLRNQICEAECQSGTVSYEASLSSSLGSTACIAWAAPTDDCVQGIENRPPNISAPLAAPLVEAHRWHASSMHQGDVAAAVHPSRSGMPKVPEVQAQARHRCSNEFGAPQVLLEPRNTDSKALVRSKLSKEPKSADAQLSSVPHVSESRSHLRARWNMDAGAAAELETGCAVRTSDDRSQRRLSSSESMRRERRHGAGVGRSKAPHSSDLPASKPGIRPGDRFSVALWRVPDWAADEGAGRARRR